MDVLKEAESSKTRPEAKVKRRSGTWAEIWRYRHFYGFIAPFFVLFAVFGLYPLLFSLYLSFVKWDGLTPISWVGLGNFRAMLSDEILRISLWNTVVIGLLYVPAMLILAFLLAQVLNAGWIRARSYLRAAFFLPCVTPMVAIAIVFGLLLSSERGLINSMIGGVGRLFPFLHLSPIPWLTNEAWSKVSVSILTLWRWMGYNMVLMIAGLQGIPTDYYEAAEVDGASKLRQMWHITLPMMRPTFIFCGVLSLIGTVYMFDEIFVMTHGGPGVSSTNFGVYLFNTSFTDFKFGYASCMAYTVAFVVLVISAISTRLSRNANSAEPERD